MAMAPPFFHVHWGELPQNSILQHRGPRGRGKLPPILLSCLHCLLFTGECVNVEFTGGDFLGNFQQGVRTVSIYIFFLSSELKEIK